MIPTRDTPTPVGLTPEQAHAYHERAGILEYDGHLPRPMAEAVALAREAMGMDWTNRRELAEAIPPAYSEHLGRQVMAWIGTANDQAHRPAKAGERE